LPSAILNKYSWTFYTIAHLLVSQCAKVKMCRTFKRNNNYYMQLVIIVS
jgi:hypothetical protein